MKKALTLSAAVLLAACGIQKPQNNDQFVASAVSAASGAAIGSYIGGQYGGGTGNIMMMLFGGAIGGMAGWSYGGTLMPSDRETFRKTTQQAMSQARDGEMMNWANPETKTAGSVTPTGNFTGKGGLSCRHFEATVATKDGIGRGTGAACKGTDGEWLVYGLTDSNV